MSLIKFNEHMFSQLVESKVQTGLVRNVELTGL